MTTFTITCDCTTCNGKTTELPDIAQYRDTTTGNTKKAQAARHNLVHIAALRTRMGG